MLLSGDQKNSKIFCVLYNAARIEKDRRNDVSHLWVGDLPAPPFTSHASTTHFPLLLYWPPTLKNWSSLHDAQDLNRQIRQIQAESNIIL